jgi:hypothetical protein
VTQSLGMESGPAFLAGLKARIRASKRFIARLEGTSRARVSALRVCRILSRQEFWTRMKLSLPAAQKF